MHHVDDAADEVAVAVGEVAVVALHQCFEGEASVLAEGNFAHEEVAHGVVAEHGRDGFGAHDVAARLRHLGLVKEEPAVGPDGFWRRDAGGHEECRPVDAVKAADFFADEVHVGWPEFLELAVVVGAVAEGGNVIRKRVEPHVDDVLLVAGHGNSPGNRCAGDGEVFQAAAHKREDLAARRLGAHEVWIGIVKLKQFALEG